MKKFIWSKRNYLYNSPKYGPLLYVGNSNSFLSLDKDAFNSLQQFIIGKTDIVPNEKKLKEIGAIVESDESILSLHKHSSKISEFCSGMMELWICMTNECNFKCSYCFENKSRISLSEKTMDSIVDFISKKTSVKYLIINFYGGEPLLNLDGIIRLYSKIEKLNIKKDYRLITNGYLLDENAIQKLSIIKDLVFQVTIDGNQRIHNMHRPHKTNDDSYQVIMHNLETYYKIHKDDNKKVPFIIRYNVDRTNAAVFPEVYLFFKEKFKDFYFVYSTPVQDYCCGEQYNENLMTNEEYALFLISNYEKYSIYEDYYPQNKRPFPVCGAACHYFYCIGSDGNLYKCASEVGHDDRIIYNINTKESSNSEVVAEYSIDSSPYEDPVCKNCFLLYSCMGTCAKHMIFAKKYGSERACIPYKFNTPKFLEMYYENVILKNKEGGKK